MQINEEFISKVRNFIEIYPKSHSINSLKNAFELFEKAKKNLGTDNNISLFCAITAVEEAVSAIFLCLKHKGYDGSDKINHHNHVHKAAFYPFCKALTFSLQNFNNMKPRIVIDREGKYPRLQFQFFIENQEGQSFTGTSDTPFGFIISNDTSVESFESNLKHYFGDEYQNLTKWLRNRSNLRNKALYASPKGIPKVEITDQKKYLKEYEQQLNVLMMLYFLIEPYSELQLFVQQALHAFIKMIGNVPNEDKLLEFIENRDREPIAWEVDLNTVKIKGLKIEGSAIQKIEYRENEILIKCISQDQI